MVYCCVPFCKSSDRRSTGISFNELPVTQIRQEWLKKISRQAEAPGKQPCGPSDRSKVCSLHFKPEDYREGLKLRKLKPAAIPSIFPSYAGYMPESSRKGRQPVKRGAVPGLSADKPHAEAKKNRPDIPSPYWSPSERTDEQAENCVADSSTADKEDEMLTEPRSEPSSLPLILPSPESSFCLPKTYETPEHGQSVEYQTSPSKATRRRGMQTRLSLSRMTNIPKKVQNLTRKCQRL
ncbi:THAP domain-containing protein 11-like [Rhipicephalus sanguineus]|uniref:THAP domain-containing protein 11-like n=1 Tax=Rhipicephalus sanguineus TaxID=34632 RepID=UPI001895698F|nr:THAP domain-containing protein 11-like [Rhipicephalus sanguineus]